MNIGKQLEVATQLLNIAEELERVYKNNKAILSELHPVRSADEIHVEIPDAIRILKRDSKELLKNVQASI